MKPADSAYNEGATPIQVQAVYENGVLRPLDPLELAEHQRVTVTVTESTKPTAHKQLDSTFIENLRQQLRTAPPAPGLDEVRRRLSKIPGRMTDDFVAEREDR